MAKNDLLTKILATVGAVLVWFTILVPFVLGLISFLTDGIFRFDYLLPAELFFLILIGGGLLLWAAFRARARRALIGWGLGVAAGLLVGGQALAVVTGLASGETAPEGWPWVLLMMSLGLFWLALLTIGAGGILLLRDLRKGSDSPTGQ